jgi:hypothetical protein
LYDRYKEDGLVVLGVHAWTGGESKGDVKEFVREHKVTYPILLGGREAHRSLYKCKFVPRVFFIDRTGRIAATKLDFNPGDERKIERQIRELL